MRHFDEELEQLKTKLLEMSALVESSIQRSISAVIQKDRSAAEQVFRNESAHQRNRDRDRRVRHQSAGLAAAYGGRPAPDRRRA